MNSFAALDSDNEDEIVVQKPAKKEAAKVAPAVVAAPVKAAPASSAKPVKAAGAPAAPRAPKGNFFDRTQKFVTINCDVASSSCCNFNLTPRRDKSIDLSVFLTNFRDRQVI
jgi:hypothetical protein